MRPTDSQEPSSSTPPSNRRFSIFTRRRDQVHSIDAASPELEAFQRHVGERFQELSAVAPGELLSVPWIRKLLDAFFSSLEQFGAAVLNHPAQLKIPPMDKCISNFFHSGLTALDICNAVRDGIEHVRQWMKSLEIVLSAIDTDSLSSIGEVQIRRAKKALVSFTTVMFDEKESLSWSVLVSGSWSAAKELQAIGSNLTAPRSNETISTNGLNMAVFTMSYVLLFVMWALVAAIPCQGRGLQTNFHMARQFVWAKPILSLHERILAESKRRRNARGLLKEILDINGCAQSMNELTESVSFPLTEEEEREVRLTVMAVRYVYEGVKEELDPLERVVREVFSRIVRIRREGLDKMNLP